MGWTTTYRPKGWTDRAWFQERVCGPGNRIIECATVRGVFYAAVESDQRPGEVWALVCLTQRSPKSDYNYGWKDMDETMHPYYYAAPAKVLNALTPTQHEQANLWRGRCWSRLARRLSLPKVGETIRLETAMTFGGGQSSRLLTKVTLPHRRDVYRTEHGQYVRFTNLLNYEFEKVAA